MRLEQLPATAYHYMASIKGTFPEYSYPTNELLVFKVGAQVMFIKNDSSAEHLFYNGKIGHIIYLDDSHIEVLCPGDEHSIVVEKQTWENTTYKINEATKEIEPTVQGTFSQYPLRLAWAITIHKSQGLTFERAIIDAGSSFASGQVYVALSRCKTLEGLVLASPITAEAIINDQGVADYINRQDEEARKSIEQLPRLKDDYERFQLIELFQFMDIWRTEEMLCRLLIEFFHNYSKLILIHKSTVKELQEKVTIIAYKWTTYISQLTIEQIHDPQFLERVVASANYFKKTLKHYLEDLIEQTLEVKSNNKVAMRRLDNYLTDLREMYLAKKYLLQTVITNGFTTENYLRAKQEALLMALDELSPTPQRRSKSTKKKKEKKENTKDITLQLLKRGLTPLQIATERKLTTSTIYTHLGYFVKQGVIDINDFMEQEHIQNIQQVIQKIGVDNGRTAIKALCLPTVTYEEINLIIAAFHRS